MSESLAKEFFPSSNGMRPNTASFTSNGLTLPKKHGISILIETFHYLYTQNIETSDSEWHFTKLKWHFFELKWHFTVVKCHSADEACFTLTFPDIRGRASLEEEVTTINR